MSTEPTQTFRVDGVELAWDRWGSGEEPELLLCHGFSGTAHDFALHTEALAEGRPVLALDHRGHGRSTKLRSLDGYSLARLAEDLAAFVEANASGPIDLLGHSMGGHLSLRLVLDHPGLVRSLILMDTSGWSFRPLDDGIAAVVSGFLEGFDPASDPLPDPEVTAGPETHLIAVAAPTWWQERSQELAATFDPYALKALGTELFGVSSCDLRDRLGELDLPVTVIVGSEDHPFVDQAEELAERTSGQLSVIEGAYHSPQLTHQEVWRAAVEHHLSQGS